MPASRAEIQHQIDAKRRKAAKTQPVSVTDTFLKALCEHYSTDSLAPGIVVSWLPDRGVFYCSVRRYSVATQAILRSRVVVAAVAVASANRAVAIAMKKWREEILHPRQTCFDLFMQADIEDTQPVNWNGEPWN